ncbi:cytochrome P450 [bacterium]|nr:cytochrome P450 [bacterium]
MLTETPIPPGKTGLPLVGETLAYLANGYEFIERRRARFGPVFRTNLLGRPTAVISGPDACASWIDPEKIQREGSMPPHIQEIFGGRSLPLLDGVEHRERKSQVLAGFGRDALEGYLPQLEEVTRRLLDQWVKAGEIVAAGEFKRLAIEGICRNVMSLEPGPTTDAIRADFCGLAAGMTALPIPIPGSTYSRALAARGRLFAAFDDLIRQHRAKPLNDGLSRILDAKVENGTAITDDAARLELHHVVIAGYVIFAEFTATLLHLSRNPEAAAKLREEVRRESPSGPIGFDVLRKMPYLLQVLMEVKRLCPILPAIFGKAKRAFEFKGYTIPKGWMVIWAIRSTHLDQGIYQAPDRFDPDRFSPGRAEQNKHEHAFSPHGPGAYDGHKCPGTDYATLFMDVLTIHLLRDCVWDLPPQDLEYNWRLTPPEPKDGLRLRLRR